MTTTAVGPIAIAKERFKDSIANTTAFRTWDGNNWSVAQAKTRIYFDALPPPANNAPVHSLEELNNYRPFCLVYKPPDAGSLIYDHVANGTHNRFSPSGFLVARFERLVPQRMEKDPGEASRTFENFIGQLITTNDSNSPGLAELAGNAGYLNIRRMIDEGPYRSETDDIPSVGDCQWYYLTVEWGARVR
jgi:hypothetical protein